MKGIRIVSKVDGFRRGGVSHTGVQDYPLSAFNKQQIELLRTEANLVVQDIDLPDEEKPVKTSSPAKS